MSQSTCLLDNKPHHHYQLPSVKAPFSFLSAFKFAETRDKVSLCLTLILITVSATCFPVLSWIFGSFMQLLADWQNLPEYQTTFVILLFILILTAIVVPITFMASRSLMYSIARRQVSRFRQKALESMLNYAVHGGLNYSEKSHHANYVQQLEQDCSFLLDTIGSKFPTLLWILGSITLSILVALFRGFQLALVSLFIFPVFYIAFKAYQAIISDSQPKFSKLYEKPDLVVREVLKNIKAVVGLGGEYHELEKYEKSLLELERKIEPSFLYQGFALGGSSFLFYIGFALSLYVGNLFIQHGVIDIGSGVIYTLSDIICVTMCLYICVPIMYFAAPCLNAISKTEGVLVRLFSIIDTNYISIERRSSSAAKGLPNTTLTLKEHCQLDQNLIVHRKGSQQEEEEAEPLNACPMSPIWIQKPIDASKAFNFEAAAKGDNITSVSNISVAGVSEDTLMRNSTYHPQTRIMLNSVTLMSQKTEGRCLLDNVTLEIMGKRATAIVVREQEPQVWIRSFFKLIQGIRRPDKGSVTVNESDLQCVGQDWGRENIFEIPDEPIIFPMTMRENLTLNRIHMSNEEIWRKIDAVDCDGLFSVVKKNLNKQIGFTENQLTQQDKRLIGILRAYFAEPSIFLVNGKVFEGANSQKIGRVLHKITKNKTLIIACPSMESVKGVETVLVAENGKLEELSNPEKGNGTLNIEDLNQCSSNIGSPKSLSLSNSRRSSIIPYLEIKIDGGKDDEEDTFIEKIDTEDLDELNEVLGSYEESLVMNNDNELDEYYERLWQLVQAEASTFLFALLPTLANSVLVPLVITLIAKMLELIVSSISTTAPRRLRRSLAEVILVTFIIFGCYLVGISRLMWFKLKASNILRKEIFAKVLRMHVSWHAEPENAPEIISKRLNEDVNKASNAISLNQSLTAQIILNIVAAVVMTIFADSQLGLISLSILLVLALVSTFIDIFEKKYQAMHKSKVAFATQFMSDAFDDIATLQRLPRKQDFLHYAQSLTAPTSYYYRKITLCKEIFVSFACFAMFVNTAIILVVGLPLYSNDEIKMESFIVCLIVPLFTIFELFKFLFLIVDSNTTTEASTNIFNYFDTKSLIDIEDRALLYKGRIHGDIEFRNVAFTYPGQKTPVLRGLSFKVSVNNKPVVILGGSKSGKEAISLLLLRMYEPDSGDILIDGINIKNYNLHYLRRKIGVIFENPCLFPGTVEYNVKYAEEYVQTIEAHDLTRSSAGSARSKAESVNKSAEALELGEIHKLAREMTEDLYDMQNVNEEAISAMQKYRITVARTILRRPCAFVFELPKTDEGIKIEEMLKKVPSNATKLFIVDAEKIEEGDYDVYVLDEGEIGGERRKEIVKGKQEYLLLDI